jgi:hypothetical protein
MKMASEEGIKGEFEELCENKEVKSMMLKNLQALGK